MAAAFGRSVAGGYDMIYDYCCTTCAGQKMNAQALFYCKDCSKLLCEECKKYHEMFLEGHRVLGRKEVTRWGDINHVKLSLMCDEHPGKELEMYCEDHGVVCCHICISVNHRFCKKVKPVTEVSKGIQKMSEYQAFLSQAVGTQSRLKTRLAIKGNNIKMLEKARGEIISTFKNIRKKLNQIVDRLEEDSTVELDRIVTMLKEQLRKDRDACSEYIEKIQKFLDEIQTLGKECDELAFQCYKKCNEQMVSADKLLSCLKDSDCQFKFIPNSKINQYLSSLKTFGSFDVTPYDHLDNFKYKELAKFLTPPGHLYSVVKRHKYNIKTSIDTETCCISGICKIPDGNTAIVDSDNTKVKLLSVSAYSLLDELRLPPYPGDICYTKGTELAVTVNDYEDSKDIRKEIRFINAENGKLAQTRTVQLDHECFGIAYHNAQLYVGSTNALHVYNMSGKKLKKIYGDTKALSISKCCLSDDGSRIYVLNSDHHLLLTLDSSGQKLSTFSDPALQAPIGVCIADNGSVFVCGWDSDTVLQLDREGSMKMTTLATKDDGICNPQSLCYDRKTQSLLVGHYGNDNLLTLQLK